MAYLLQMACLVILAEVLLRLIPVASAGFRYAYWRLVLGAALVAPWALRAAPAAVAEEATVPVMFPMATFVEFSEIAPAWSDGGASWLALASWIVGAGAAVRALWVLAGILRLRMRRRTGASIDDALYDEIQHRLGTSAELRSVPALGQPVTFGLRRPVVLLPDTLAASADAIRRAVVTHELVHVQRRDWLWVMAEEALRAAFWFHPAIWWATSRVRLTREEFTDHLAVLATGSRRQYMEALLAFADTARLEPAPAFARRAHLFHRIVLLSKEAAMSSRRIVVSGIALAVMLVTGAWYASEAFPVTTPSMARMTAAAPQSAAGQAVEQTPTPENPIPRRLIAPSIPYPPELSGTGLRAAIELRVVLNASGSVASATRVGVALASGGAQTVIDRRQAIDAFVAAAIDGVRRLQYDQPFSAPLAFYVAVTFTPDADGHISQSEASRGVSATGSGARVGTTARLEETIRIAADAARAGNPYPVRVGGAVGAPTQTRKVAPIYPEVARTARVQGVVILELTINEQGRVTAPRILRSIPLLDQAAIDAVRQWEYTPTLLNGVPVPVIMTVTVAFTLA